METQLGPLVIRTFRLPVHCCYKCQSPRNVPPWIESYIGIARNMGFVPAHVVRCNPPSLRSKRHFRFGLAIWFTKNYSWLVFGANSTCIPGRRFSNSAGFPRRGRRWRKGRSVRPVDWPGLTRSPDWPDGRRIVGSCESGFSRGRSQPRQRELLHGGHARVDHRVQSACFPGDERGYG